MSPLVTHDDVVSSVRGYQALYGPHKILGALQRALGHLNVGQLSNLTNNNREDFLMDFEASMAKLR